ncbi:MAG TPA: hypothetical protein VGO48_00305 [Conexibacter sp.]|jgi:hypothetical protein|nr:hypothetical protein [Conexibacter sp.]
MTDAAAQAANNGQPTVEHAALAPDAVAPAGAASPAPTLPSPADERPELVVGAAFAGGLALALFLKRLAR